MSRVELINQAMLAELSAGAASSPRLRKNLNFHPANESPCHRMLNALQPGTYVQPHCHTEAGKDESIVVLSGKFGCLIFDEAGKVIQACTLQAGGENSGINIPLGVFHSLVALAPDSVFFESKQGPWSPLAEHERGAWAPREGEPGWQDYLAFMLSHF